MGQIEDRDGGLDSRRAAAVDGAATASSGALRMAHAVGNGRAPVHGAMRTGRLALMCREAAAHLARAHEALFEGAEDGQAALAHLDAALACLKDVATHSTGPRSLPLHRKPRSA